MTSPNCIKIKIQQGKYPKTRTEGTREKKQSTGLLLGVRKKNGRSLWDA